MVEKARLILFVNPKNLVYRHDHSSKWIRLKAVSGGGRGQKIKKVEHPHGIHDSRLFTSLSEREKPIGHHRGGPLPHGAYRINTPANHNFGTAAKPHMVHACELIPTNQQMYGRNDFFIHGQGQLGSDGCIVPLHGRVGEVFQLIAEHGGGWLQVETMEKHGIDYDQHWASNLA